MVGFVAHGEIAGMPGFFVHRPFGPRLAPFQPASSASGVHPSFRSSSFSRSVSVISMMRMMSMRPRLRVWNGGDRPVSMIRYACPA